MTFGASGIGVSFGDRPALSGVDFDLPGGRVSAVVGGDGAGKSTLLHCLAGTVTPAEGTIRRPSKRRLGFMPAQSGTWADLTVDENISFVATAYGLAGPALESRRADLLERAALGDARDRLARDLSGGMRRKLGFILAILHEPDLLLLDEPSTGVDPVSRVELWRLVAETAANGTAVAMTTTYLDEAERASSVLVLDEGRILASGTTDEVIGSIDGTIAVTRSPAVASRAWRRGRVFHEWRALGATPRDGDEPLTSPDLEDAVIALMVARREQAA
jgi:ABC-type multidrug transport system ATPase subunit